MSNSVHPWIRAFIEKLLQVKIPEKLLNGEPSSNSISKPLPRPSKAVQIIRYFDEVKVLIVSDTQYTIPLFLTEECQVHLNQNGTNWSDLRTSIISLDDYFLSTSLQAIALLGTSIDENHKKHLTFPFSIVCNRFAQLATDLHIMKDPTDINREKDLVKDIRSNYELYLKFTIAQFKCPEHSLPIIGNVPFIIPPYNQPLEIADVYNLPFHILTTSRRSNVTEQTQVEDSETLQGQPSFPPLHETQVENTWQDFQSQYFSQFSSQKFATESQRTLHEESEEDEDDDVYSTGGLRMEVVDDQSQSSKSMQVSKAANAPFPATQKSQDTGISDAIASLTQYSSGYSSTATSAQSSPRRTRAQRKQKEKAAFSSTLTDTQANTPLLHQLVCTQVPDIQIGTQFPQLPSSAATTESSAPKNTQPPQNTYETAAFSSTLTDTQANTPLLRQMVCTRISDILIGTQFPQLPSSAVTTESSAPKNTQPPQYTYETLPEDLLAPRPPPDGSPATSSDLESISSQSEASHQPETLSYTEDTPGAIVIINDNTTALNVVKVRKTKKSGRKGGSSRSSSRKKKNAAPSTTKTALPVIPEQQQEEEEEETHQASSVQQEQQQSKEQREEEKEREDEPVGHQLVGRKVSALLKRNTRNQGKLLVPGTVTEFSSPYYMVSFQNGTSQMMFHHELVQILAEETAVEIDQSVPSTPVATTTNTTRGNEEEEEVVGRERRDRSVAKKNTNTTPPVATPGPTNTVSLPTTSTAQKTKETTMSAKDSLKLMRDKLQMNKKEKDLTPIEQLSDASLVQNISKVTLDLSEEMEQEASLMDLVMMDEIPTQRQQPQQQQQQQTAATAATARTSAAEDFLLLQSPKKNQKKKQQQSQPQQSHHHQNRPNSPNTNTTVSVLLTSPRSDNISTPRTDRQETFFSFKNIPPRFRQSILSHARIRELQEPERPAIALPLQSERHKACLQHMKMRRSQQQQQEQRTRTAIAPITVSAAISVSKRVTIAPLPTSAAQIIASEGLYFDEKEDSSPLPPQMKQKTSSTSSHHLIPETTAANPFPPRSLYSPSSSAAPSKAYSRLSRSPPLPRLTRGAVANSTNSSRNKSPTIITTSAAVAAAPALSTTSSSDTNAKRTSHSNHNRNRARNSSSNNSNSSSASVQPQQSKTSSSQSIKERMLKMLLTKKKRAATTTTTINDNNHNNDSHSHGHHSNSSNHGHQSPEDSLQTYESIKKKRRL